MKPAVALVVVAVVLTGCYAPPLAEPILPRAAETTAPASPSYDVDIDTIVEIADPALDWKVVAMEIGVTNRSTRSTYVHAPGDFDLRIDGVPAEQVTRDLDWDDRLPGPALVGIDLPVGSYVKAWAAWRVPADAVEGELVVTLDLWNSATATVPLP